VTLPYARRIAAAGIEDAARQDVHLKRGINVLKGSVTCRPVAEAQGLPYQDIDKLL
jgi:alanine dehydrogenase